MGREKIKAAPPEQSRFFVEKDGSVRLSSDVSTLGFGQIVTKFLTERAIWRDIPKEGQFLLIEADEEEVTSVVDRNKWFKVGSVDLKEGEDLPAFSATIVAFSYNVNEVSSGYCEDLFGKAISYLNEDAGGLFVIEKTGPDENHEWRKRVLKEIGLVDVSIFTSQKHSNYLVWAGRLKKEPPKREAINLIDRENPNKNYWWARRLWWRMITHYHRLGYGMHEQEKSELFKRLQASKNPYFDINLLKMMVGVDLESTCSCLWKVPLKLNAEWKRTYHCPDEDCDGVPKIPNKLHRQ